ncbi:MAG: polysaccharide biosynthesis protein, partial [Acidimicrobiia bacterium]
AISVIVIGALLTLGGMGGVRFRSRLFSFNRLGVRKGQHGRRVLVVGTGRSAVDLARYGSADGGQSLEVVGFVSPGGGAPSRRLAGLPVLGPMEKVPELVERHNVHEIVVATPDGSSLVRRLVDLCLEVDVRLRILPDATSLFETTAGVQDVRDLQPADLLPRPAVDTDLQQVASVVAGRRVLVTGAGGSIGSELVRQVQRFGAAELVALDHDETHLHDSLLGWSGGVADPATILCDVRDRERVMAVFARHRPEVVFHAAAHKHVPILQACPEEAVKTNVIGTANVLEAARIHGAERFVLISTDKAAEPSSVMGASKRVAEMLAQAAAARHDSCVYSSVRFGNVLGSRGSVVPTFLEQIRRGGPVTVTDVEMMRYFMTVGEAVELVLQAAALADGGEVFVLDMGEPVRIVDLAHRLIRLAGMVPGRDIEVKITGRRPGEKLSEILSTVPLEPSNHPKINLARQGWPGQVTLADALQLLTDLADQGKAEEIAEVLGALAGQEWAPDEVVDLSAAEGLAAALAVPRGAAD